MDDLTWLTRWYAGQCDGGWEHQNGIKLDTLDNPGWTLAVSLEGTDLEDRTFAPQQSGMDSSEATSWWSCLVEHRQFKAVCGPHDLPAIIAIFRKWADPEQRL